MCRLDIYYPVGKPAFSTVVWYHGGGLTGERREIPEALKDKGLAVVGVEYRLADGEGRRLCRRCGRSGGMGGGYIASVRRRPRAAFAWPGIRQGHLTSMIGLDKRWLSPYGIDPDTAFVALIPYSGQVVTHFERRREPGLPDAQPLVDDMAPLSYVRPDCRPMLIP